MRTDMSVSEKFARGLNVWKLAGAFAANAVVAAAILMSAAPAHAFPWDTDMFAGPEVQPLEMAPRVTPDGILPIDGIHYNVHYGQPKGMPNVEAIPPMKLELMTVKMHNPLQPTNQNLVHGKALFSTTCAPCHGLTGKGDGSVVHLLQHKPANLMTGVSKNLPDGYIFGYIRNGGIWMPSYGDAMSATERWQVVLYVRSMQQKYGETEARAGGAQAASTQAVAPPPNLETPEALRAAELQPGAAQAGTTAGLGSGAQSLDQPAAPAP
jgi:mono/diheme cytochrome c family protein